MCHDVTVTSAIVTSVSTFVTLALTSVMLSLLSDTSSARQQRVCCLVSIPYHVSTSLPRLLDVYELVQHLFHHIPLPTSELLFEETCRGLIWTSHVDTALAVPYSRGRGPSSSGSRGFSTSGAQSSGPGHYQSDCPKNPTRRDTRHQSTVATAGVFSSVSASPTLIDDPQMSQTLRIGRRHGRLFQLVHLHLPISTAATTSASSSPSFEICTLPLLLWELSSSSAPYLIDPSIELFLEDVDVPAVLPDDDLHAAPLAIVYPVESPSTDSAPLVAHLVCRSTQTTDIFTKSRLPGHFDALVTKLKLVSAKPP
ncbi:hypothetical protein Acr_28g0004930 [Actinidia rufa]|uniref:Uncharacterized protein n=1 Tax=Actinidia rufa TaxID=165716 RepID=A0A7J0H9U4_9ERIC|nr:hypothetical protein Acr_28g0004930 [Actinidia rufa]